MTSNTMEQLGPELWKKILNDMLAAIGEAQKEAYKTCWDSLILVLKDHWCFALVLLLVLFLVSFFKAIFGRWGMLGSFLYNVFYFGILFLIGLIFGSDIFANTFFDIFLAVLYIFCYSLVGIILRKMGFI
jgi:hypothetical protein